MPRTDLHELRRQLKECCESIAASDKIAVESAQRIDRLRERVAEHRRDVLSRLATLERRIDALERQTR